MPAISFAYRQNLEFQGSWNPDTRWRPPSVSQLHSWVGRITSAGAASRWLCFEDFGCRPDPSGRDPEPGGSWGTWPNRGAASPAAAGGSVGGGGTGSSW